MILFFFSVHIKCTLSYKHSICTHETEKKILCGYSISFAVSFFFLNIYRRYVNRICHKRKREENAFMYLADTARVHLMRSFKKKIPLLHAECKYMPVAFMIKAWKKLSTTGKLFFYLSLNQFMTNINELMAAASEDEDQNQINLVWNWNFFWFFFGKSKVEYFLSHCEYIEYF